MSYPNAQINWAQDNILRIVHPEVLEPQTYLTAAVAVAGTTLTVRNNAGFSNDDPQTLLLFEALGSENAEVKMVNGAVTAGTSLTTSAVTYAHSVNCSVSKILFDQVEISGATTATGTKTVIATVNLNVSGQYTDYVIAGTTYSYYFARYKNSLSTTAYYGAYSDAIAATDFGIKTVGYIRRNAFKNMGEELGGKFDNQWVYDTVYAGEYDVCKELKRWSWLGEYNYDLGNVTTGMRKIALPSDIEDNQTNKSILGIRIGRGENLTYMDKSEYDEQFEDIPHTTVGTAASVAATTLVLTDSRDFADSGTIKCKVVLSSVVFSNSSGDVVLGTYTTHGLTTGDLITVSGCTNTYSNATWQITYVTANTFTLDSASWASFNGVDVTGDALPATSRSFTYTENNKETNRLLGLTALTVGIAADVDVWQDVSNGTPSRYTVIDSYIYFDIPPDDEYDGKNIWIDYFKYPTKANSDGDTLTVNDPYLIQLYLEMMIKKVKNSGELKLDDPSYIFYETRKAKLVKNELSGQKLRLVPNVPNYILVGINDDWINK